MAELAFIPSVMPSANARSLPAGTCDTHCHIFGPFTQYPLDYPPDFPIPLAPLDSYQQMLALAGVQRGVLVQPSQQDCSVAIMLDALATSGGAIRGVAAARSDIPEPELEKLSDAGVVGLRFVEAPMPSGKPRPGAVGFDQIAYLASRMRALNWSINVWAKMPDLMRSMDQLLEPELPLVIEHMGMLDVNLGHEESGFQTLLALLREGRIWVKLSVSRCSMAAPDYADLRPFAEALIEANPDQIVWGSDWPFIRMQGKEPDVSHLLHLAQDWIADAVIEKKIFVDNAARLFRFNEVGNQ